jgi:TRAP-type transport system periplasmic protein
MKRLRARLLISGLVAVCLFCCSGFAVGQEKTMNLAFSTPFPPQHKMGKLSDEWGKEIEKRTNGKIKITIYYAGTLTPGDKSYDGVVNGLSDLALTAPSYNVGRFPLVELFDYPLGYTSCVSATKLVNEFYNKFKPKEYDDVKVMYFVNSTIGGIHTNKEVHKLQDLKGMKIRSTGTVAQVVDALGGTPVALPIGETYDGISRGVVQGIAALNETLFGWKFAEVTKFSTEGKSTNVGLVMAVVMNKAKWNGIPPETQRVIEEINKEWIDKSATTWDEMAKAGKDFAVKLGHKFIPLSEIEDAKGKKALAPLFEKYVKDKKAKGLPADEVLKFAQERLKQL